MSSVTFPTALGGSGATYSDTDMLNNGHETLFIPMLAQEVIMAQSAAASAVSASASKDNAALSATSADASKTAAAASAATALSVAAQNLTAISTTQTGTIVAPFVYPTAKDSDGGLACSKAGLPALMGIEATSTTVTIYNVTDVTTPQIAQITGLTSVTSVFALHGRLYVGHSAGLSVYDMLNSFALLTTYSTSSTPAIVANTVQCITATVLPTAPIDNATGLPTPTIWVGTLGGVSRIADDNTVSNWTDSSGATAHRVYNIATTKDFVSWSIDVDINQKYTHAISVTSTLSNWSYLSSTYQKYSSYNLDTWATTKSPIHYSGISSVQQDITKNAFATNRSLTIIQPNTTDSGKGLHATITKDFNSGYQFGDIRGAWLCTGTAGTITTTDPDVSYKNNPLTVAGTITKAAVGTGNDLMWYSGFSASNYLTQAYSSTHDYGTVDFIISCWTYRSALTGSNDIIFDRAVAGLTDNKNRILLYLTGSGTIGLLTYDATPTLSSYVSTNAVPVGAPAKIDVVRLSTGTTLFYINGVLDATVAGTVRSVTSAVNALYVGRNGDGSGWFSGKLDLFHIGAGAPAAATIKSRYEKEKLMFVAGTKCMLPGTSNDVKSIDYDDSTDIHHYVTGDYYGAHKGLVRVDSAAGVYTSISAKNGAIIKGA